MKRMLQTMLASVVMLSALPMLGVSPATMRSIFVDVSKKGAKAVELQIETFRNQRVADTIIAQAIVAAQGLKVMDVKQKLELEKAALAKMKNSYKSEAKKTVAPLKKLADDLLKLLDNKNATVESLEKALANLKKQIPAKDKDNTKRVEKLRKRAKELKTKVKETVADLKNDLNAAKEENPIEEKKLVENVFDNFTFNFDKINKENKDIKKDKDDIQQDLNIFVNKKQEDEDKKNELNENIELIVLENKKNELIEKKEGDQPVPEVKQPEKKIEEKIELKVDFSTVEGLIKNAGAIKNADDITISDDLELTTKNVDDIVKKLGELDESIKVQIKNKLSGHVI